VAGGMDACMCVTPSNIPLSSPLGLRSCSRRYRVLRTRRVGGGRLLQQHWGSSSSREEGRHIIIRMSSEGEKGSSNSDRSTVLEESRRLLAKQKELLQQVTFLQTLSLSRSHMNVNWRIGFFVQLLYVNSSFAAFLCASAQSAMWENMSDCFGAHFRSMKKKSAIFFFFPNAFAWGPCILTDAMQTFSCFGTTVRNQCFLT
jgi:hypothetical protein